MNERQREVVSLVGLVLAGVLFVCFFLVDFLRWLFWRPGHDLLSQLVAVRPDFPSGGRDIGLGLVLPVLLAGFGLYLKSGGEREP